LSGLLQCGIRHRNTAHLDGYPYGSFDERVVVRLQSERAVLHNYDYTKFSSNSRVVTRDLRNKLRDGTYRAPSLPSQMSQP